MFIRNLTRSMHSPPQSFYGVIILIFGLAGQAWAATTAPIGSAATESATLQAGDKFEPQVKQAIPMFKSQVRPARVRIGVELTPYRRMLVKKVDGQTEASYVAMESMRHTLRARLDQSNHFYVGDYHITTEPLSWNAKTQQYKTRINIAQRYGAAGNLEESVGTMTVEGQLQGSARIYDLQAKAQQRFRAKSGQNQLDVQIMTPVGRDLPMASGSETGTPKAAERSL